MRPKRAKLAGDIVVEFLPPRRASKRVVIILDGLPTKPSKAKLINWFSKRGYWALHMRYRGTWESGGQFLDHEPSQDVFDLIDALPSGFTDVWSGELFKTHPEKVFVVGSSFGGCTALMCALNDRVDRVVSLAPVTDWTAPTPGEPHDYLEQVVQDGYGGCYRFTHDDWWRLGRGELAQPIAHANQFDPQKLFIIHAEDDTVVPIGQTRAFLERVPARHRFLSRGDHLSANHVMRWPLSRSILNFFS